MLGSGPQGNDAATRSRLAAVGKIARPTRQHRHNQKALADARGSVLKVHIPNRRGVPSAPATAGGDRRNRLSHQEIVAARDRIRTL